MLEKYQIAQAKNTALRDLRSIGKQELRFDDPRLQSIYEKEFKRLKENKDVSTT